jgi:hypothetical protein
MRSPNSNGSITVYCQVGAYTASCCIHMPAERPDANADMIYAQLSLKRLTVAGSDVKDSLHHLYCQALLLLEKLTPPSCDAPQPHAQLLSVWQLLLQLWRQAHAPVHTTPAPERANTTHVHAIRLHPGTCDANARTSVS